MSPRPRPPVVKPPRLRRGDAIGICTPSFPAHVDLRDKYLHGLRVIEELGFRVVEGALTRTAVTEGYRSGSPQARAEELMGLFLDPDVRGIVATIGGSNSASLVPYLDFDVIRQNPKVFCGYSDVTSLHMALLAYAGLSTFYGPAVAPSFGDWPTVLPETRDSFLEATMVVGAAERELVPPARYSRHVRRYATGAWKTEERQFEDNVGPILVHPGRAEAPAIVANLNTLVTAAGTTYFPELEGRVLVLEEMSAPLHEEERDLRHLERLGVFERIVGLVIGKPETYSNEGAPFEYPELVREIVPLRTGVPVVMEFDCGHTMPMFTIAEETTLRIVADEGAKPRVFILGDMVT